MTEEFEKVLKRQRFIAQEAQATLDKCLIQLEQPQDLNPCWQKCQDYATKILESHKDFHHNLQKYTKNNDKKFKIDLNAVWDPLAFDQKEPILNEALASHFIREGLFELEETFEKEAKCDKRVDQEFKSRFHVLFTLQQALKLNQLEPVIEWAKVNHYALEKSGSQLEFLLHQYVYIQHLLKGEVDECLNYSKLYLCKFSKKYLPGRIHIL
jgi:RNAse (barnase) inhibitor barstar